MALDSSTVLLVDAAEPGPIQEAARDLAGDFEKVFGKRPRIVTRPEDAAPVTVLIGLQSALVRNLRAGRPAQAESFTISVRQSNSSGGPSARVVLLTGADMRGTLFAVYPFAQEYLGVDPLYYWTDHEPTHRARIELPEALNRTWPAPVIRYRGFFINDEDLLTGWAPGGKGGTGISLDAWNRIYETILRLKGNIVAPGTWIFPDEPQIRLAAIGRAIALGLAGHGAHTVPSGRRGEHVDEVCREVKAAGAQTVAQPCDVRAHSLIALRDAVLARFGRVDALVNAWLHVPPANSRRVRPAVDSPDGHQSDRRIARLPGLLSRAEGQPPGPRDQHCLARLVSGISRSGSVLPAKAGLASLTRSLACEWARDGISAVSDGLE